MPVENEAQARRILELDRFATLAEAHRSYLLLKRIHGEDWALFAAPGMAEFAPETRAQTLAQIEAAYELLRSPRGGQPAQAAPEPRLAAPPEPAADTVLGRARLAAGWSLDQVAGETHVRRELLRALEAERFECLDLAAVNVRGYVTAFANTVGLCAETVVPPYMAKFNEWLARNGS